MQHVWGNFNTVLQVGTLWTELACRRHFTFMCFDAINGLCLILGRVLIQPWFWCEDVVVDIST